MGEVGLGGKGGKEVQDVYDYLMWEGRGKGEGG